jgi:hypothetical protein
VKGYIVGKPSAESDLAIARKLERFLQSESPGTTWHAGEGRQGGSTLEAPRRELDVGSGRVDDQRPRAA